MNIVICGAGQVGSYTAEVMAGHNHNITVIDTDTRRLRTLEESLDVRTLVGNCAAAETLRNAGADRADLVVAATNNDEANLLGAAVAGGLGAGKCIARVHHREYFEEKGLSYKEHLRINGLICPEFSTARAIARTLRNPGAIAIESFARGQVQMQELTVSRKAKAVGRSLAELRLPAGARLVGITRNHEVFLPDAQTTIQPDDVVILTGNTDTFQTARKWFGEHRNERTRIVIMGGPSMAVWVCRALRDRNFSIRVFERKPERAAELADIIDWATVLNADPIDPAIFKEESLEQADTFVGLVDDDERNILGSAWAKSMGVKQAIAVVQRPNYLHLLSAIGINHAFSPRIVAVREILNLIDDSPVRKTASLGEGVLDVYQVQVGKGAPAADRPLREVKIKGDWVIAAVQSGDNVFVPGANDSLKPGDTALVVARHGMDKQLIAAFQGSGH